ncbi:MAG: beta-galactosidase trimerization domain-containing protein [Phycisphaerae bacterium]
MKHALALTIVLLAAWPALAGVNLLKDGGFEQVLDKPDERGNPFSVWGGWKWEGNCQRVADTEIKHGGKTSALMFSYGNCKIAVSDTVKTEAGLYKLTGYVRGINLTPGAQGRAAIVSFEPKGKEMMTNLPNGTYGWRKFELVVKLPEPSDKTGIYVYLFGSGRVWLDDFVLEKLDGTDHKEGLTMSDSEEKLTGFDGPGGLKCPSCGLMVDPKAQKCAACGELAKGLVEYGKTVEVVDKLAALVEKAKAANVDTLYAEAVLKAAPSLLTRWVTVEDGRRSAYATFLSDRASFEAKMLETTMAGAKDPRVVPPIPDYAKLQWKGNYLQLDGKTALVVTVGNSGGGTADPRFAGKGDLYGIVEAVGASRYDYDKTPIWEVYQKDPKSHRVYDGGWCGHIIKDKWSIGGAGGAQGVCVISLDYPPMLEAVRQSIVKKAQAYRKANNKRNKILAMDWEYTYENYDEPSKVKWQNWLKERYTTVDALNKVWKTSFKAFDEIDLPPINSASEKNPAKYYDHGEFSLWRFTDYLKWAKAVITKEVPDLPIMVGGGMPFGSRFWKESIDEEGLMVQKVDDIWLSETGSRSWGTGAFMDLQHSMNSEMPIVDPEYHSTGGYLCLMYFHGAASVDFWDWPRATAASLGDGYSLNHGVLDVRRLQDSIIEFPKAKPQVALLYSRASLIQRHPGASPDKAGVQTPYTLELQKCYRAGNILDAGIGFVTSRQVKEGIRKDLKVLVVPGAYFENEEVVQNLMAFAQDGGTLVVTPTSLVADEYNRKRDYLKGLGVEIVQETVPKYLAAKATAGVQQPGSEYDFIQGPIAKTVVEDEPKAKITWKGQNGPAALDGAGIRQTIKVSVPNGVLATYEDGSPAVVRIKAGKGQVIYTAMQLTDACTGDLLDWVYAQSGVERLVRTVGPDGKRIPGLESKTVPCKDGYLTYVYNLTPDVMKVSLKPAVKVSAIENLNTCRAVKADEALDLGPFEWFILKLTK